MLSRTEQWKSVKNKLGRREQMIGEKKSQVKKPLKSTSLNKV